MTWRNEPMLAFDVETDSPNPEDARIISACVAIADPAKGQWQPRTWLLQPERDIPEGAAAIHGITTAHARGEGIPREQGIHEIRDALTSHSYPVVIYNAPFDTTVLNSELARIGEPGIDWSCVIDPLVIDKAVVWRKGSRRLADVAAYHGIAIGDAHDAAADALATARLAWKLAAHPGVPDDLAELHVWQRDQYREQRLSFIEYRNQQGRPIDDQSTDWPTRTTNRSEAA